MITGVVSTKYEVGDYVKVKSWESLEENYGLTEYGDINLPGRFNYPAGLKHLCGQIAIVSGIEYTEGGSFLCYRLEFHRYDGVGNLVLARLGGTAFTDEMLLTPSTKEMQDSVAYKVKNNVVNVDISNIKKSARFATAK